MYYNPYFNNNIIIKFLEENLEYVSFAIFSASIGTIFLHIIK